MKVLTGHLTQTNIKAINAILNNNLMEGKVGNITYFIKTSDNITYSVSFFKKDRGMGWIGEELRLSRYTATFQK